MNVNLFDNHPSWRWYILAGIVVQVLVTSGWIVFKFTKVCHYAPLNSHDNDEVTNLQLEDNLEGAVRGVYFRLIEQCGRCLKRKKTDINDLESGKQKRA